jgi:signal transduction histidine kinase
MKALGPARSVCMSEGDLIYAAYVMFWKAYYGIYSPVPLKQVAEEAKQDWEYVKTTVFADGACLIASPMVDAFALMGSEAPITKQAIHAGYSSANLQFGVVLGAMGDAYTQYLLGKTEEAWQACRIAQDNIVGVKGFFTFGMQHAFRALIALKLERSGKGSSETQAAVQESRIVLERLSMEAPVTFGSWRCLVEAEASSSSPSSIISAIEFYDRSIELAGDTGLTNVQALAYELAGSFYLRNKGKLTALKLLRESLALYEAWGAFAVCNRIVVEFGSLDAASADESVLSKESIGSGSRGRGDLIRSQVSGSGHSSPPTLAQALDFDATLRFCQAISSQHSVSSLITEFRRTIGQCTNATRVAVLFPWDIFPEEARRPSTMPRPLAKSPTEPKHSLHASDGVSTLTSLSAQSVDTTDDEEFPESIVREAAVTREPIFVDFAMESRYCSDPYISEAQPKSLLAYPVYNNNALFCVVYLEQDDLRAAFSPRTLPVLNAISTQLAISHDALVSTEGLRASKLKLEELSKVKDRFLATLSHELKTPLHSMSMCLGLLNDTLLSAEQRSYLEVLQSSSMVLQRLLVDLMDLSKMRTGTLVLCPAPCSVQDLVLDVISNFQDQAANKNMETVYLTPGVLPKSVLMDAKRFKQLISVFVDNAVKFSRPGGMVEITLESFGMDGDGGRGNSAAQCLRVSVRDNTGPGIKPETRDQLFEPFSQLDTSDSRQFGGFGNGLALSKLIADQMRGAITVESDGFAGSRFTVELPVTVLDQSDVMDSLETAENALHGGPTPERMSEAILGSKSLVSYCKRFAASADVVGGVAREHGMSFERCMSREDLEAVLRDNRPRVHETAILVDEDTLAEVTRMHDSKAFSRVVLCLRRNGSIPPFPERTFPITIPVLKPVALSALRKCFPHRLPVSAPVSEVTSLESAEMPLLQPLPLLPLGPGESKGTATLPAPPLAPEAVVSEQKASPRPRKGSDGQPGQPQQSPLTQQHVLIVEDNLVNAKLLRNILKRNGYTSDIAENGAIGVEMARANEYCIILMDIQVC